VDIVGSCSGTFFWTVDTHFGVLRVLVDVLAEALKGDRTTVDVRMNAFDAKLAGGGGSRARPSAGQNALDGVSDDGLRDPGDRRGR
jgi:hypothetical protein